ncbi:hypothetical protein FIBSPDRAFT_849589 [Athelia psychrophila]|uniref:Uncharacterized protein n=1 Tax=Athelia psychrophila TaxID=1759441 RepID=A0A166UEM5_9AGAM|nr:hypothetical protein FIBSPDRAFT_849589 [Fibularhizoctonia sp. CBS 109695]
MVVVAGRSSLVKVLMRIQRHTINDRPQAHLVRDPAPPIHETTSTVDLPASRFGRLASASRTPPVAFQNTRDTHASWQRRILVRNTQKISWILHGAPAC